MHGPRGADIRQVAVILFYIGNAAIVHSQNQTTSSNEDLSLVTKEEQPNMTTVISLVTPNGMSQTKSNRTIDDTGVDGKNMKPVDLDLADVVNITRQEGDSIQLNCPTSNDTLATSYWRTADGHLDTSTSANKSTLIIDVLETRHKGTYVCVRRKVGEVEIVVATVQLFISNTDDTATDDVTPNNTSWHDTTPQGTNDDTGEGGPRYIGIAIGLGVCVLLLLLSGGSVFILNLKRGDAMYRLRAITQWGQKKDDQQSFTRMSQQQRQGGRPPKLKILPMPLERVTNMSTSPC